MVPDGSAVPCPSAPADGEVTLRARELALLSLLDGRRTVGEVVALSGRGEFAVVEDLAGLVQRGLVQLDATSAADALLRRQEALRAAESTPGAAPSSTAASPGVARSAAPVPAGPPSSSPAPVPGPRVQEPPPLRLQAPAAPAPTASAPSASVAATDRHGGRPVTPVRPEVLAPRQPEHPEPVGLAPSPAGQPGTAGATALAAAPDGAAIGIDPEITRTMLMRLIAGVRGL